MKIEIFVGYVGFKDCSPDIQVFLSLRDFCDHLLREIPKEMIYSAENNNMSHDGYVPITEFCQELLERTNIGENKLIKKWMRIKPNIYREWPKPYCVSIQRAVINTDSNLVE